MFDTSFGYIAVKTPAISDGHFDGLVKKVEALEKLYTDIGKQAQSITGSGDFTKSGKKRALAKIASEVGDRLDGVRREQGFGNLLTNAANLESEIRRSAKPKEPSQIDYLRAKEIRDYYKDLDSIGRQAFLEEALRNNSDEIVDALRNSPVPLPGLQMPENQERLASYDADELSRIDPEKAAERNSLLETHRELELAQRAMVKSLREEYGIDSELFDNIRHLASDDSSKAA